MIARVIVNSPSRQTDKQFDYLIPEKYEGIVKTGIRVLVPFGRGNKQVEGYVTATAPQSGAKNLKEIASCEEIPVFDEKMLEVIEWMREKYLCTYIDIIKTLVPAGTMVKNEEWAVLCDMPGELSVKEKKIVKAVEESKGACEINCLMQYFEDENIYPAVKKLYQKGILKREYRDVRSVTDKTVRIVRSLVAPEDIPQCIETLTKARASAQAKVMEVLSRADIISASDLEMVSQCGYNTILALKKRGLIEFENIVVARSHRKAGEIPRTTPPVLTMEQENACEKIRERLQSGKLCEILLHGVTGSGKTEVFMNVIKAVVDSGRQAVMLVPEIALTPQMMERFIARFGERVAVYHSGLSMGERYDEWKKMRDGTADIVIGARSAVFAPFKNIGIIIVDEEHESSYKSEVAPRYDAKEVAHFRAAQNGCAVVYASATPDIRTYYKAQNKKIDLLELKTRANKRPIPEVSIVDMRAELAGGNKTIFSKRLIYELSKNIENHEQSILFLNRRGFSTFVSCRSCGFVAFCPNCNISLTYHKFNDILKCHYCGYTIRNYKECPKCGSKYIRYFGGGTQKVEEEVKKIFPNASTIRMDVDTTSRQNAHEKLLGEFEKNKIDILIGTQMVAKGLDFPNVTLVGVVSADTMLNIDDYRSSERSFDLLEQVSGRAGRAEKKGRAVIQTYSPEHNAIIYAKEHDYLSFFENEIALRKAMWYPPFCEMVSVLFTGVNESLVSQCAKNFAKAVMPIKNSTQRIQILGPVPAAITKIKNKYRWRIIIKCANADRLTKALYEAYEDCAKNKNFEKISIVIDKNPNNIM